MATLKDIAEKAQVSYSTVSRILNNDVKLVVTPETREKVLKIAKELNYKTIGQRYKDETKKKYRVGIAQMFEAEEQLNDIYYILMKNVLEEICLLNDIQIIPLFRNEKRKFIKNDNGKLDGIFAIGRFTVAEIESFEKYTENIVFIDSSPDELTYFSIIPNYQLGVKIALDTFMKNGHKKIGFIGSKYTFGDTKEIKVDARYSYFVSFLTEYKLYNEDYFIETEMNAKSGYENIIKFIKSKKEMPTGFFISSDSIAPGILRAFKEFNINIPDDVSIITFNDTNLSEFASPPLSSIKVFMKENVKAALRVMSELWEGDHGVKKIVIPCNIVERESVKKII